MITREELIKKTDIYIKNIIKSKETIKELEGQLKDHSLDEAESNEIQLSIKLLQLTTNRVIKVIGTLDYDEQRIICYRYFESLTYKEIALRVGWSASTVKRRIKKALLRLGRTWFGFEKEFYENFYDGEGLFN